MSHYLLEVVMPPTDNVEQALEQIMQPFAEQGTDEEGTPNTHTFWDFYSLGGRWAGAKLKARIGKEGLDAFCAKLHDLGVTVSGVQFGKPTLQPAGQRKVVDALWREAFPNSPAKICPLFDHYPKATADDICRLDQLPAGYKAERVIIAKQSWRDDGTLEAGHMSQEALWNGVNHEDSTWDSTVTQAVERATKCLQNAREDYKAKNTPQPDWLVVTVDYHS